MKYYKSPWSVTLIVVSSLTTTICLALTFGLFRSVNIISVGSFSPILGLLPVASILLAALFAIRGFTITDGAIIIHRLLWSIQIPITELKSVEARTDAMRGCIRLCGNGGVFSFTGYYRSSLLGSYRAYVTDMKRTVVLRFQERTIVLSPDSPEAFADDLQSKISRL